MLSHWQPPHHYNSMPEGSNLVDGETCSLDNISIPHDRISIPTMGSIRLKSHTSMREELFRFSFGSQWLTRHLHRQLSTTLSRSDMASSLATHHQNLNGEHDQGRQPLNDNPSVPKSLHGQKSMIPIPLTSTPFGWTAAWLASFSKASAPTSRGGLESIHHDQPSPSQRDLQNPRR